MDSITTLNLTWDPATILPLVEDPNLFTVTVSVYSYDYDTKIWEVNSDHPDLPNSGHVVLDAIQLKKEKDIRATCIQVSVGQMIQNSSNSILHMIEDHPLRVGIWTGLLFSIHHNRKGSSESLRMSACQEWFVEDKDDEIQLHDVADSLPPCPPTQGRAQLPNSGLEQMNYTSIIYSTNYHNQWMETFHPNASICFMQATVTER